MLETKNFTLGSWRSIQILAGELTPQVISSADTQVFVWLFDGCLNYEDEIGNAVELLPTEVFMISGDVGAKVSSQQVSGVILSAEPGVPLEPTFDSFAPEPVRIEDQEVAVLVGEVNLAESPVEAAVPLVAAEIRFMTEAEIEIDLNEQWQYALLSLQHPAVVAGEEIPADSLSEIKPAETVKISTNADAKNVVKTILLGSA